MLMDKVQHILFALRRHKIAACLIMTEVALACALFSNAVFLIQQRIHRIGIESGVSDGKLVDVFVGGTETSNASSATADTRSLLMRMRTLPGVVSATVVNQVPFAGGEFSTGIMLDPNRPTPLFDASVYMGDESFLGTMGLRLAAGRNFAASEVVSATPDIKPKVAIITRSMADRLFSGSTPIGHQIYLGDANPVTIIGMVEDLLRPRFGAGDAYPGMSIIVPAFNPYIAGTHFVIRTRPEERQRVVEAAVMSIAGSGIPVEIIDHGTFENLRISFFREDASMAWLLVIVCVLLLTVTALGIFGVSSFWVQKRTRQIGIRRALGATRREILRHFLIENALLVSMGAAAGVALAYIISHMLTHFESLPALPFYYAAVGILAALLLGQLSVLVPALRAAAVPPAVATRAN